MFDYNYFFLCDIEKKDAPEEKDVYFYDLSDDTVFVTEDPEVYNNLFKGLSGPGGLKCITRIHNRIDHILFMIQGAEFFFVFFLFTKFRNIHDIMFIYLFHWTNILVNYIVLCILCNRETLKLKNRSKVLPVVKTNDDPDQKSKNIEARTVREYMKEGFRKHKHQWDYIFYLPEILFSVAVPFPILSVDQITGLDSLPHNCLRLLLHLNRIEKTQNERI